MLILVFSTLVLLSLHGATALGDDCQDKVRVYFCFIYTYLFVFFRFGAEILTGPFESILSNPAAILPRQTTTILMLL